jgi:hypothetical protein
MPILKDADELTPEEKASAAAAQVEDDDPLVQIAAHLGCEATADSVAAELARIVELANAIEGIADELGLDAQEAKQGSYYLDGVRELTERVEALEERASVGEMLEKAFDLSRLSLYLIAESADPATALVREVRLSRSQLSLSFAPPKPLTPTLAERLAFHLGVAPTAEEEP